jgi:hypothetical protein
MLKPSLRRHKWVWIVGTLVLLLIAVRVALPSIVKDFVNDRLMALENYDGHVLDVDLALWRGAYQLEGIRIVKTGADQPVPFFDGDRIYLSIEWKSLFRGSVVAESVFTRPNLNLVRAESERRSQTGKGQDWQAALESLFPFRFNTVKVVDGVVTFRAPGIRVQDALEASRINGVISNITNVVESDRETYTFFQGQAAVLKTGSARLNGTIDPFAKRPAFDLNLTVKNVRLPEVNPWLRQYIKADAEAGEFELYTELAAKDGRFTGYAKPIMRDVDIYSSKEEEDNPLRRLWEGIVDFAAEIVEDEGTDQVAARIPFSGTVENPDAGIFETVVSVLHNAFVSAFARSLEDSISLRDVEKKLGKIGKKGEKDEKDRKAKDRD